MKIQIDFNRDDWRDFGKDIPDDSYTIIEESWEDSEEWAILEIHDKKWQTWISIKHPEWIIEEQWH